LWISLIINYQLLLCGGVVFLDQDSLLSGVLLRRHLRRTSNYIGVGILGLSFLPYLFLLFRTTGLVPSAWLQTDTAKQLYISLLYSLRMVLPFAAVISLCRIPLAHTFPVKRTAPSSFVWMLLIGLCVCVLGNYAAGALNQVFSVFGFTSSAPRNPIPSGILAAVIYFINLSVLPAILEEFAFRGVVLQALRPFGDGFALFFSSLLFGLAHANFTQAPFAFLMGLVMGYFCLRTGSILIAVAIHFFNNLFSVVIDMVNKGRPSEFVSAVSCAYLSVLLLLGILAAWFLSRKEDGLFSLPEDGVALPLKNKVFYFLTSPFMALGLLVLFYFSLTYLTRLR